MKIVAISDLHGELPIIEKEADIMIIAGDISPMLIQFHHPEMIRWLKGEFTEWIKGLPVEKVYLVAGNHDFVFQNASKSLIMELQFLTSQKLIYLKNESVKHIDSDGNIWNIFGTPYCHIFGSWAFMCNNSVLEEKFQEIPNEVDIIISHDPPFGVGYADVIMENPYNSYCGPEHCGSKPLRNKLEQIKYKWLFCGHIHSGDHNPTVFGEGSVVNVSILDESYSMNYKPFYINIDYGSI